MGRTWRGMVALGAVVVMVATGCSDDEDASKDTTTSAPTATTADDGYGATTSVPANPCGEFTGTVEVDEAQTGDGASIKVKKVTLEGGNGHIAVHIDADGSAGAVVGHASVTEGETVDLEVPLDAAAESGKYWPMLHSDDGDDTYEFGPGTPDHEPCDGPVVLGDTGPVMAVTELTVG